MMSRKSIATLTKIGLVFLFVVSLSGCHRFQTGYGESKGQLGRESLNGFGALRGSFEQAGCSVRGVTRLTERVKQQVDTIVWTPKELMPISPGATTWFENWLAQGNHTLVYIIPDSGSESDYWRQAATIAPPKQRLEYRKRLARAINKNMTWRVHRASPPSNGWFVTKPTTTAQQAGITSGPWPLTAPDDVQGQNKVIEFSLAEYTDDKQDTQTNSSRSFGNATGPSSVGFWIGESPTVSANDISFTAQVQTESGQTIVGEVTSEAWAGSRIVVVAGGSLLTNFALTKPSGKMLTSQIIQTAMETSQTNSPSIGFASTGASGLPVSEREPGIPTLSGLEFATVWPLSLVTIHGVILGVVICMMLWPIFGRPRQKELPVHNDFGDHLDCVAALMQKSGDEAYARSRIAQYQQRVRGEASSPWVVDDETPLPGRSTATTTDQVPESQESTESPG